MPIEIFDTDGGVGNIITGRDIITEAEYVETISKHLCQKKEKFQNRTPGIGPIRSDVRRISLPECVS